MFCRSPVEIITERNNGRVKGIKLEVNTLEVFIINSTIKIIIFIIGGY